ncbi:sigma-54-dependent transcriptional regulator [Sandaracinus amylolyticus]|uniref:C4-dicarboxylate transport transcriptional regulatory protein n=1 Tax=Sandaracinus amylolyticus TaxID=927083 RepID=A0A0F6SGX5_9BACT|nr:sigma-54 dependent transcriptional regulator [Sandaracinus amylolyticus]AKF09454.1 C4-dicarboxylate transport transcriptional regulatory protein [Sandaracinus amylolyticus]
MPRAAILVVDDEKNILSTLSRALRVEDFDVDVAGSAEIGLEKARVRAYDAYLVDVNMPGMDGLSLIRALRDAQIDAPVLVMSGQGTIETAVEATRLGAHDFLEKPIGTDRLLLSLERALQFTKLAHENESLRERVGEASGLIGESAPMRGLRDQISLAASASANVLIMGERGTGKELVAAAIHRGSKRNKGPFEKLNCAAVPSELIESELFGHEAGAFTGATKQRRGKFERATKGTLFLDEVGDMPSPMQAKLLRVLQEGEIERVGGGDLLKVDVRVVAATNKPLKKEIEEGRFRADLFDRLNVVPLRVPSLRERIEDVPVLAGHFLRIACAANDRRGKSFSEGALAQLGRHDFPGNVRELRNLVERLVILVPGDVIHESDVRAHVGQGGASTGGGYYRPGAHLEDMVKEAERDLVLRALEHHQGHITRTAADLGLERSHLYKKMKALGIRRDATGEVGGDE